MRLITEFEFTQMEVLLAALLKQTETTDDDCCSDTRANNDCFQILKLHARLMEIFENQSALRDTQERLQKLVLLDATKQTFR